MCHAVTRKPPPPPPAPEPPEPELKERVLHTRVPERLAAELRQRASALGISVSNLVRNVLDHTFGLVEDVVTDGHAVARAARGRGSRGDARPAAAARIDDVLGWQPIVLGKNAICARCNAILPRGKDAAVGVGTELVLCPSCLEELRA
jgi:hypothetical protein